MIYEDEICSWITAEIDIRLERLSAALAAGDDVGAKWQETLLAGLVRLRRVRRAQTAANVTEAR